MKCLSKVFRSSDVSVGKGNCEAGNQRLQGGDPNLGITGKSPPPAVISDSEREGIQARKGKGILGGSSSTFRKANSGKKLTFSNSRFSKRIPDGLDWDLSKKMARLRRTARKSVPGGPYHVEGFRLPEQKINGKEIGRKKGRRLGNGQEGGQPERKKMERRSGEGKGRQRRSFVTETKEVGVAGKSKERRRREVRVW
ncbi:hypothetical protein AgCh_005007 [Apium graveolens]